jgi:putative colanic acid biosynthesis acetyltransferase WcaF
MMRTRPREFINTYSRGNRVGRLAWGVVYTVLFRPTPWFMGPWRSFLLRLFGAKIKRASVHATVRIWAPWMFEAGEDVWLDRNVNVYNAFGVKLGDRVVISQNVFLCSVSHDYRDARYALIGNRITIEDDSWVAADAFVAPGVSIGPGSVVGARAVVIKNVAPWTVVAGNPARVIRERKLNDAPPPEAAG